MSPYLHLIRFDGEGTLSRSTQETNKGLNFNSKKSIRKLIKPRIEMLVIHFGRKKKVITDNDDME